jgi:hypothetical protein
MPSVTSKPREHTWKIHNWLFNESSTTSSM